MYTYYYEQTVDDTNIIIKLSYNNILRNIYVHEFQVLTTKKIYNIFH